MTDDQLRDKIKKARSIVNSAACSLHGLWDVIFDAEAILAGKPSILSREEVEAAFEHFPEMK